MSYLVNTFFIFGNLKSKFVSIPTIIIILTSSLTKLAMVEDEVIVVVVFITEVEVYLAGDKLL